MDEKMATWPLQQDDESDPRPSPGCSPTQHRGRFGGLFAPISQRMTSRPTRQEIGRIQGQSCSLATIARPQQELVRA